MNKTTVLLGLCFSVLTGVLFSSVCLAVNNLTQFKLVLFGCRSSSSNGPANYIWSAI